MLFDILKKDRIQAMKDKDAPKKDLLGTLIGEASKESKEPTDEKVVSTIKKFIGVFDKSIAEMNEKGIEVPESLLAEKESTEKILSPYLPKQLTEDGIRVAIMAAINLGNTDVGSINKFLKAEYEGRYDGKLANQLIQGVIKSIKEGTKGE